MTKYLVALFLAGIACTSIASAPTNASGATPPVCTQITSGEIASIESNPYYSTILSLWRGSESCRDSFALRVVNNTNTPLEILWGKTFYVHDGIKGGKLVFGQSPCGGEANLPKTSLIPPGGSFSAAVWPEKLLLPKSSAQTCSHSIPKTGRDGVFLTVKADGMNTNETITMDLGSENPARRTG